MRLRFVQIVEKARKNHPDEIYVCIFICVQCTRTRVQSHVKSFQQAIILSPPYECEKFRHGKYVKYGQLYCGLPR